MTLLEIAMQALEEIADAEGGHVEITGCQAPWIAGGALNEIRRQQYIGVVSKPIYVAHFEFFRTGDHFASYRLENSGHIIQLPREWFGKECPRDISIEIHDRQLRLEQLEQTNAHG